MQLVLTFCYLIVEIVHGTSLDGYRRNHHRYNYHNQMQGEGDHGSIDPIDFDKLANLYGRDVAEAHRQDFVNVGEMGQHEPPTYHPKPPPFEMDRPNHILSDAENSPHPLTPSTVKKLLRELLERLDKLEEGLHRNVETAAHIGGSRVVNERCSLHGLWISAITGVAFQLQLPNRDYADHNTLQVQIVDSGVEHNHNPELPFVTSKWTGTAQVAAESPTTISIILQEEIIDPAVEPKTSVFVGQCVVCSGSPTIQGTWILFPKDQICFQEGRPPQSDVMYLLLR